MFFSIQNIEVNLQKHSRAFFSVLIASIAFLLIFQLSIRRVTWTQPGQQSSAAPLQKMVSPAFNESPAASNRAILPSFWKFSYKITINASKVSGTLANFPVFVNLADLPAHFFSNVKSNGADIKVTMLDSITQVPRELVSLDVVAKTGELHFKAPILSSDPYTRQYLIYYKNDALVNDYLPFDPFGAYNVWSNGFAGVWHKQQASPVVDSREFNIGTTMGGVTATTGIMGGALAYDGVAGSYVSVPNTANLNLTGTEVTMTAWMKPAAIRKSAYAVIKLDGNAGYGMAMTDEFDPAQIDPLITPGTTIPPCNATDNSNQADYGNMKAWAIPNGYSGLNGKQTPCALENTGSIKFSNYGPTNDALAKWSYMATTYNGSNAANPRLIMYYNGVQSASFDYTGDINATATNPNNLRPTTTALLMGALTPTSPTPFAGSMDEVRVANVARSADWITTEYNNQSSPNAFYSFVAILPISISTFTANKVAERTVLSWTTVSTQNASHFDIERSTTGVKFTVVGTVAATENSNTKVSYSWTDNSTPAGKSYYRLKLVDKDEMSRLTQILTLDFSEQQQIKISPNPVVDYLTVYLSDSQYKNIEISITDANGKILMRKKAMSTADKLDLQHLPRGTYFVQMRDEKKALVKTFKLAKIK